RTLTLTRSLKVAPASSSTCFMFVTTKPNCASKPSGNAPASSKPGMPETNRRSPTRVAKESGGALMWRGAGKCLIRDMEDLSRLEAAGDARGLRDCLAAHIAPFVRLAPAREGI